MRCGIGSTAYGRLQEAVSKLTRENQALAQSYRDTFMEQAKAENAAFRSQQAANALSAPGLNRPAKSARDSASVFENNVYAPKVDPRTGLDAFLAGKGAVDSAVMSVTTLESVLGRVQKKGKEVAGALAEVERAAASAAQERVAAEQAAAAASDKLKADAAAEMQRLAQSADALRAELDPAVAAQNRFNAALDRLPNWTAAPGEDWPARATVEARLAAPDYKVEIAVIAAR
jgi:enamine deaminase RidA (YjgF/YER057c/UK114 family)